VEAVTICAGRESPCHVAGPRSSGISFSPLKVIQREDTVDEGVVELVAPASSHHLLAQHDAAVEHERRPVLGDREAFPAKAAHALDHTGDLGKEARFLDPLEHDLVAASRFGDVSADFPARAAAKKTERRSPTCPHSFEDGVCRHSCSSVHP
jgi:hypothetical protein